MDRGEFLKAGALVGVASMLSTKNAFAENLLINKIDKLVDTDGNFVLQPLPYAENFLEPYMDSETLHLHYTFHHGGAVTAANKDLLKIKDALDNNNLETIDFWTKKLSLHVSSHVLHTIFWTNLTNKTTSPSGDLLKRIEKNFGSYDKLKTYIEY
jgi:superoxide dismutase, Fe-Mn family